MDSGRFILAVVLMIAVMIVTNILFPTKRPNAPVTAADSAHVDSLIGGTAPVPGTAQPADSSAAPAASTALPSMTAAASVVEDTVFVQSDSIYRYGFSTRGGSLVVAQILKHENHAVGRTGTVDLAAVGRPLIAYKLSIGNRIVDLSSLSFTAVPPEGLQVAVDGGQQLRLLHTDRAGGFAVEIAFDFKPKSYLIDAQATVRNIGDVPAKLLIAMGPTLAETEVDSAEDARHRAFVLNSNETGVHDVTFQKFSKAGETVTTDGPFSWVALRSKYFVSALLESNTAKMPFGGVIAKPVAGRHAADLTATLTPGSDGRFAFRMYVGPQEPKQLEAIGNGFKDVNPFGWRWARPILRPVGHGIAALLYGMHDLFGIGYGWVLIMFGVLIRVLLWPLNAKAMRSQMKNMEMQPRIKDLQARYKKDPEKLQKEMLKLYKEEGFNPMGGCLPSLIPFPILITLYFVFANAIAFRGVPFLWLPDLSRPDPLYILPVVLGISMFVLQWFSTKGASGEQGQQMKIMMYTMPPFMTLIFLRFAAGLNLYYAAMNIASIPQQMQILRERERFKAARTKV
jgi:YidC/Oxa1 family membrane protein insertase